MTTYLEASELLSAALGSENPHDAYDQLVKRGMDLSQCTMEELLLLTSRYAGNQCVLFRGMTSEQRIFIGNAIANNQIIFMR